MTNILFICKYNLLRSRIAETYFKKINKNKKIKIKSAGVISGGYPLDKDEKEVLKEFNINLKGRSKSIKYKDLTWADLVIITANNVPKNLLETKRTDYKIKVWNIPDVYPNSKKSFIKNVVLNVMKKTEELKKESEKWKQ